MTLCGQSAGGLERTTVAEKAQQARSHVGSAEVSQFPVAQFKKMVRRQHRRTKIIEFDLPDRLFNGVRTKAAGVLCRSVLNIFEYAGRNPGVPVDDAHVEAVFNRLTQDVRLLCRRDTDEFLDLFGEEDVNCLGFQFRLSLRDEEQRAEPVISGPPLDSEHDLTDVAVTDTLHDDTKKRARPGP